MSAIANLQAYDGTAVTPVVHVLVPVSVAREGKRTVALYREQLPSVPTNAQVRCEISTQKLDSGIIKNDVRSVVPVMETISGQNSAGYTASPKIAFENTLVTSQFVNERSDSNGRTLARQLHVNILGSRTTSLVATLTGPVPELFDQLVMPT